MNKEHYCNEADCEGAPGCPCLKPEAWEEWKFNKIHDKHELFELAQELLDELTRNTIFMTSRNRIHYDGERLMQQADDYKKDILSNFTLFSSPKCNS